MTLKNTDNYTITVKTRQILDNDTDIIEEKGEGRYFEKDKKKYILYKTESDSVMITVEKNEVRIKRSGSVDSLMVYIKGKTTDFKYRLPYGMMKVRLETGKIIDALGENGGELRLIYTLDMNNMKLYNDTRITLKR